MGSLAFVLGLCPREGERERERENIHIIYYSNQIIRLNYRDYVINIFMSSLSALIIR